MPPAAHEGAEEPIVTSRYEVIRADERCAYVYMRVRVRVCAHVYMYAGRAKRERNVEGNLREGGRMSEEVRSCWKARSAPIHGKEKTVRGRRIVGSRDK